MTENIIDTYYNTTSTAIEQDSRNIKLTALGPILDQKEKSLRLLYYAVFGSEYSVFGDGDELSCLDLVGGLLLVYRYMTVEQFSILFPDFSTYRLANLCHRSYSNQSPLIASASLIGRQAFYYLTETGFQYYKQYFPVKYLAAAHIPNSPGKPPATSRAIHDVKLRDVPYALLSIKAFDNYDWYTSVPIINGKTTAEAINEALVKDKITKTKNAGKDIADTLAPEKENLIADAILHYKGNSGNAIIIEQDSGTEKNETISQKLRSYGDYFSMIENIGGTQLLFNIFVPDSNKRKGRKNTYYKSYKNIRMFMEHDGISQLDTFYKRLTEYINRSGLTEKTYENMKKFLDEYIKDGNSLSDPVEVLASYAERKRNKSNILNLNVSASSHSRYERLKGLTLKILKEEKARQDKAISPAKSVTNDEKGFENLLNSIKKGVGLLFTDNILRYAYFIFPFESGYINYIFKKIKDSYGKEYTYGTFKSLPIYNYEYALRNCIEVTSKINGHKTIYSVVNISSDIGAFFSLTNLLNSYSRTAVSIHLLLLVSSIKDAEEFINETDCIEKFCSQTNIALPNLKYDVKIRFLDYSMCSGPNNRIEPFVIKDGEIIKLTDI